jgi:tetratricopeptide (TPR) repeat protein
MRTLAVTKTVLAIGFLALAGDFVMAEPRVSVERCGNPFDNGAIGPWDYLSAEDRQRNLPVIERHHFNRDVENLVKGQTSAYIMQDLDYVLRAFPGHHRALASLLRYAPSRSPAESRYFPTECYFQRAISFNPNDPTLFLIYGVYLAKNTRHSESRDKYLAALAIDPDYAEAHYNLGLLYVKERQFELAVESARRAYDLGFPLQGLKRQLKEAGVWGKN